MAKVKGLKEKLHMPLYDTFFVPGVRNGRPARRFEEELTDPRVIRFFVDIQNKTRLETNAQAAGQLPSLNTYEARAMRVIASTFCPPRDALEINRRVIIDSAIDYRDNSSTPPTSEEQDRLVNRIQAAFQTMSGAASVNGHIRQAILDAAGIYSTTAPQNAGEFTGEEGPLVDSIVDAFEAGCAAASTVLAELIYNSVTTLIVGEKIMIEVPTFYFPSGAGVSPGNGTTTNHGEPDPMATFRFAEPVTIPSLQNFRVEMQFPQGVPGQAGVPGILANVSGPLRIWVLLDGYLTRDVQ